MQIIIICFYVSVKTGLQMGHGPVGQTCSHPWLSHGRVSLSTRLSRSTHGCPEAWLSVRVMAVPTTMRVPGDGWVSRSSSAAMRVPNGVPKPDGELHDGCPEARVPKLARVSRSSNCTMGVPTGIRELHDGCPEALCVSPTASRCPMANCTMGVPKLARDACPQRRPDAQWRIARWVSRSSPRIAIVREAARDPVHQPQPPLHLAQQDAATVRGEPPAVEPGDNLAASEAVKFKLRGRTLCAQGTSLAV